MLGCDARVGIDNLNQQQSIHETPTPQDDVDSLLRAAIDQYHRPLSRLVHRLLGWAGKQDVEDVLQEVWLAAWRSRNGFRQQSSVQTWLTRIAIHKTRNHQRFQRVLWSRLWRMWHQTMIPERKDTKTFEDYDAKSDDDRITQIQSAMQKLRTHDREVLVLHYLEEIPIEQLATLYGKNRNAIDARLSRARRRLAMLLPDAPHAIQVKESEHVS